jgi:hypothetical protein
VQFQCPLVNGRQAAFRLILTLEIRTEAHMETEMEQKRKLNEKSLDSKESLADADHATTSLISRGKCRTASPTRERWKKSGTCSGQR